MSAEQFVQSLHFRNGTIEVPEAKARFNLDGDFRYLDKADARRVLELNEPNHPWLQGEWPKYPWIARKLNPFAGEKSAATGQRNARMNRK